MANSGEDIRTAALSILATLGIIAGLYFGGQFLAPIAMAVVLSALFRPIIRHLQRARVPAPLSAAVLVLTLLTLLVGAGFALVQPVRGWMERAPQYVESAKSRLGHFRESFAPVMRLANDVKHVADAPTSAPTERAGSGAGPSSPADESPAAGASAGATELVSPLVGFGTRLFGTTSQIVAGVSEVLLLLYLILASGGAFFRKLIHVLHSRDDKQIADDAVHEAEGVVLRYMMVNVFINLGQSVAVALSLAWIGMPAPILWGCLTFVLEFVPYLGAAVMIALLTGISLATFDSPGRILLAPGSYLLISTLQNNLVSPYLYGRRLKLNPVAVLVGVLFWWYVWGVPGAFLAVPILATMKIVADRTDRFRPIGEFLGE